LQVGVVRFPFEHYLTNERFDYSKTVYIPTSHIERTIGLIPSVSDDTLTCGQLSVVKLAYSVGFEPCHSVSEMSIENRKVVLRQQPRTADVHLE